MTEVVDEALRKVAKGTVIFLIGTLIYWLLEFICRVIIARGTTQTEYGLFSIGYVLLNIFVIIATAGLDSGTSRYIAYFRGREDNKVSSIVYSSLQLVLISGIICSFFAFFFADIISQKIFHNNELSVVLKIFAVAIPFLVLSNMLSSIFRGFDSVKEKVYFHDVLMSVLRVSFISAALLMGYKFSGIIYAYLLSIVTATTAFIIYAIKKLPKSVKNMPNIAPMRKELLYFSLPLLATSALGILMSRVDTLMLGYFKTADIVGLYNAAHPIAQFISVALSSMLFIYIPIATQLYSKNLIVEMNRNYVILTKWISSVTLPLFLIFFLFPSRILNILFGADYVQARTALQILALGYFIGNLTGPNGATLIVVGETRFLMWASLTGTTLNVILNILLIPSHGIIGASIASVISLTLINILRCWRLHSLFNIHFIDKNVLKPVILSIALIFVVAFIFKNLVTATAWALIFLFVIFIFIHFITILFTKCVDEEDINMLLALEERTGFDFKKVRKMLKRFV